MNAPRRHWLDVPYAEKDEAKAAGARWDSGARRWFALRPGVPELRRWAPVPPLPELLPGEDRSFGSGLFVDLVPSSCWFTNVRSAVAHQDWDRLHRMITGRSGRRCEICGLGENRSRERWLEAHERWDYDDATSTQTLRRLISVCSSCHRSTHYGLATVTGRAEEAFAHLRRVTGMTVAEADAHIDAAYQLWVARSQRDWTLDLSVLTSAGIRLAPPPPAAGRYAIAEQAIAEQIIADAARAAGAAGDH